MKKIVFSQNTSYVYTKTHRYNRINIKKHLTSDVSKKSNSCHDHGSRYCGSNAGDCRIIPDVSGMSSCSSSRRRNGKLSFQWLWFLAGEIPDRSGWEDNPKDLDDHGDTGWWNGIFSSTCNFFLCIKRKVIKNECLKQWTIFTERIMVARWS